VTVTLDLPDEAATLALGERLARAIVAEPEGGVLFLEGTLGAGKTTLARGFLRALGATGSLKSPTYTLVEPYDLGDRHVRHADLYRLVDPSELDQVGLMEDAPPGTWWLIEWPEKGGGFLPAPDLVIHLSAGPTGRSAQISGPRSRKYMK
jgi:tRNA threonylcarbamoyladenosine biosynthesis protein TsaE